MEHIKTELLEMLVGLIFTKNPLRYLLEELCSYLMEAEVSIIVNAEESERNSTRTQYRCGYRHRAWDTLMGADKGKVELSVPKIRKEG